MIWRLLCCLVFSVGLLCSAAGVSLAQEAEGVDEVPAAVIEATSEVKADAVVPAPTLAAPSVAASPAVTLVAKIDINNTILRNYRQLPGFYPVLARILVENAPYDSLSQMLAIPGLTEGQKQLIQANFPNFVVGPYEPGNNTLENRINKGYYG